MNTPMCDYIPPYCLLALLFSFLVPIIEFLPLSVFLQEWGSACPLQGFLSLKICVVLHCV